MNLAEIIHILECEYSIIANVGNDGQLKPAKGSGKYWVTLDLIDENSIIPFRQSYHSKNPALKDFHIDTIRNKFNLPENWISKYK